MTVGDANRMGAGAFGFKRTGVNRPAQAEDPNAALMAAIKALTQPAATPAAALQMQPAAPQPTNPTTPGAPQFDPAAGFNQPATPGVLPQLNTQGVNPYLSDPLMSSYYRMQNPMYMNQQGSQDFYGDPELYI